MEETTKTSGKNREVILLILVALIGAAGLLALQFARKNPAPRSDERSMVQTGAQNAEPEAVSAPIQKITGNLVTRDEEYPELDMGDGSGRKTFTDGELKYVYKKTGEFQVTLYARYEGQEAKLQTITKRVKVQRQTQKPRISDIIED